MTGPLRTERFDELRTHADIDRALSEPPPDIVALFSRLKGDLLILGVGGKMGPTLALMARSACEQAGVEKRIIGVARFSDPAVQSRLREAGIETIRADLLDRESLDAIPDVPNVVYMAGMKFGSTGNEGMTWAMNCYLPGMVCERFARSRMIAFSTGNVYGLCPVARGGSMESDPLNPVGDYAMSCLGRERMFQHFSESLGIPVVIIRLNYAVELRYGVLVDLAQKVWNRNPVDVGMGYFNAIWQPDSIAMILKAIEHASSPAEMLNVTGPDVLRVRDVCEQFGALMNRDVRFVGEENPDALLNDSSKAFDLVGPPSCDAEQMIETVGHWVLRSGLTLERPTHFESRDGSF